MYKDINNDEKDTFISKSLNIQSINKMEPRQGVDLLKT